jgi:hypothetical protein
MSSSSEAPLLGSVDPSKPTIARLGAIHILQMA